MWDGERPRQAAPSRERIAEPCGPHGECVVKSRFLAILVLVMVVPAVALAQEAAPPTEGEGAEPQEGTPNGAPADDEEDDEEQQQGGASAEGTATVDSTELAEDLAAAESEEEMAAEHQAGEGTDVLDEDEGSKLPWRNTLFLFDQNLNAYALSQSAQLTYNPTYSWSFSLRPRYYLSDDIFVRLRQDMEVELTESDSTATEREIWLADTVLDINHAKLVEALGGRLAGGARIRLPLSQSSQAQHRIFGGGLYTNVTRPIEGVLEGLELSSSFEYVHYFATSNVAHTDEPYECVELDAGRTIQRRCDQIGGPSTIRDDFRFSIGATLTPVEKLNISASFLWWWTLAHPLATATVDTLTGPVTIEDESDTHWRNATWFSLEASYDFTKWISGAFGMSTLNPNLNPAGEYYNPFFNINSTLYLTATVTLDALYGEYFARPAPQQPIARGVAPTSSN